MSTFPQLATHPGMNPAAVIQGDRWRIGIITESLVRLEWQVRRPRHPNDRQSRLVVG